MRKRLAYMMTALVAGFASAGCSMDVVDGPAKVEEGIPVEVTLGLKVDDNDVVTKASQASEYEYKVDNIYMYVFDSSGNVVYQHFFETEGAGEDRYGNPVELITNNEEASADGSITFRTSTLNNARIIAVANVTIPGVTETAYSLTEEMLDGVDTYAELQALTMEAQSSIFRGGLFMMTGMALDNSTSSTEIDITPSTERLNCTIHLDRSDAKVEFRVSAGRGLSDLVFTPSQWRVMRVPLESLVLPEDGSYSGGALARDADADSYGYLDTEWRSFENVGTYTDYYGFTFYMPENRKAPRALISGSGVSDVKLREEKDMVPLTGAALSEAQNTRPGHRFNNGDFTYADANSTYVNFSGTLSYTEEDGTHVNVIAEFSVHLGQTMKSGVYTPNDYETKRNTYYIYNVVVNGANDVEVEVTESTSASESEINPGYIGDVIKNSSMVYELDSHFERRILAVDKKDIADHMTWGVSTLFSNGIHNPKVEVPEQALRDYKWVKFAINQEHVSRNAEEMVSYPGNQNYYDPDGKQGATRTSGGKTYVYPEGYATSLEDISGKRLYDVHQLVNRLKEMKADASGLYFDRNGKIWVTVFIDENIYFKNPLTYEDETGGYKSMWKNTINQRDRQMHFITTDANYSPDGESSVVNTVYTFKQKSVKSLFRTDSGVSTAWGIEDIQEGDRLPATDSRNNLYAQRGLATDLNAGRENTITWWRDNLKYETVLDGSQNDPYALKSSYNYIPYACVSRNRDDNGNGVIDESEVRWYLASVRNLADFFVGQYCFDQSEFLYPGPQEAIARNTAEGNRINNGYFMQDITWHYANSSVKQSNCDIFWAEEGCATGSYSYSQGNIGVDMYAYRCVRDLGVNYSQAENEVPEALYDDAASGTATVDRKSYTVKTIDLSRYNPTSLRSNHETMPLPDHCEMGAYQVDGKTISEAGNSRCYQKFQYIVSDGGSHRDGKYTVEGGWNSYNRNDPCPAGWRMPNVRELCVMAMLEPSGWNSFASTRYSLQEYYTTNNYKTYRPGFEFASSNFSTQLGASSWENHGTRCVRDYDGN